MFLTGTEYVAIRGVFVVDGRTPHGYVLILLITQSMIALVQVHMRTTRDFPA